MSVKKTTGAFNDCYVTMDRMLTGGGGTAKFTDYKKATVFRHRCYRARKLLYTAAEEACARGQIPSTPYDDLYILMEPQGTVLTFKLRSRDNLPEIEVNEKSGVQAVRDQLDFDL